jgi:hypothetical protein
MRWEAAFDNPTQLAPQRRKPRDSKGEWRARNPVHDFTKNEIMDFN